MRRKTFIIKQGVVTLGGLLGLSSVRSSLAVMSLQTQPSGGTTKAYKSGEAGCWELDMGSNINIPPSGAQNAADVAIDKRLTNDSNHSCEAWIIVVVKSGANVIETSETYKITIAPGANQRFVCGFRTIQSFDIWPVRAPPTFTVTVDWHCDMET